LRSAVTVIIPCYNASRFIRETLDSALAQTNLPLEVLLVNDGSTDDSAEIARSYGPPVRVISQANQGESVARNRGIDEARGEWIAFLDADDQWRPEKLAKQLAVVRPDVVAVHTNLYYFGDREGESRLQEVPEKVRYSLPHVAALHTFKCPSSMLVRRDCSPRFPTWTSHAEDMIYCLELVQRGRVVLVEEPLTGYRIHRAAQSRAVATQIGWHQTMERWLESNREKFGDDEVETMRGRWLAAVAGAAKSAKWERSWGDYWSVRSYLETFRGNAEVDSVLNESVYPKWLYALRDGVVAMIRKPNSRTG
jgi:glycosyltransferase involved in cell wall biosynthesis